MVLLGKVCGVRSKTLILSTPLLEPQPGHLTLVEIGHEMISTAVLSLPLIQVERLSDSGENMCTYNWLTA